MLESQMRPVCEHGWERLKARYLLWDDHVPRVGIESEWTAARRNRAVEDTHVSEPV